MSKSSRFIAVIALFLCSSAVTMAQDDESFLEFYRQRTRELNEWRSRANAEFSQYLAAAWEEFLVNRGKTDPIGPVPDEPVFYDPSEATAASFHGLPCPGFMAEPVLPVSVPAIAAGYAGEGSVAVDFFGISALIPFSESMRLPRLQATEQDVSAGWRHLSDADFMPTVEALEDFRREHSVSDWALYTMIRKLTDAVYIEEYTNEKVLTQMFLLSQMQYKSKVGSSGGELILLLPFTSTIYQVSYITANGEDYYIFSYSRLNSRDPLYTFSNDFSAADRSIDLVIDSQMKVESSLYQLKSMPVWTQYVGEDVNVPLNLPCVRFSLDYPQSDLLTYHRSAVDRELTKAVFARVKYKILKEGMDSVQAVSFVLELIQRGFGYKTDYEMFGRAKPLFIEESFFYGSNNCKDRVLLFSWLVRDLLGLDAVMFCYQGHVACGVALPDSVKGDSYTYGGTRYVMCDPTYIGAPVGATMPRYRGVQPQIVAL